MPQPWKSLLTLLTKITRENQDLPVRCPHCGNRSSYVKYGHYNRNQFDAGQIKIQRYRCDNDRCSRKTFSILPYAFMRIIRPALCMLLFVRSKYKQGFSIAKISRMTGTPWSTVKRWVLKAGDVLDWIKKRCEQKQYGMPGKTFWPAFNRDLSWSMYPEKYDCRPSTELEYYNNSEG